MRNGGTQHSHRLNRIKCTIGELKPIYVETRMRFASYSDKKGIIFRKENFINSILDFVDFICSKCMATVSDNLVIRWSASPNLHSRIEWCYVHHAQQMAKWFRKNWIRVWKFVARIWMWWNYRAFSQMKRQFTFIHINARHSTHHRRVCGATANIL